MMMNELRFGKKVATILNRGLKNLDARTARRLRAARERALSRQRIEHVPAPRADR